VEDLEEALGEEIERGEYDSVGGLIFTHLGRLPEVGETLRVSGLEMEVLQLDGRRVARVRIRKAAGAPAEGEGP
jgi:putative hemolysin